MPTDVWGRERELAAVRASLAAALDGHPSVLVVAGEAGIGKTSVLRALAEEAGTAGAAVLWARGIVTGDAPPYWLWQQVGALPPSAGADRFTLYESIRSAVLEQAPAVVLVDDVQWADRSSLAALTYLVRRMSTERVLVATSLRTDDAADGWLAGGAELLAEHLVTRMDLAGLAAEDSAQVLRSACQAALADDEVARGVALCHGNPFYLAELGRAWSAGETQGLPSGVLDVVAHRLARLPSATQDFLEAASVLGEEAEIAVVAHCLGCTTMECLPWVQSALDARLLERGSTPGVVRFAHGLVRTALVERIPAQRVVGLHQRAAAAIEELHAGALRHHLDALARHHAAAAVVGGEERRNAVTWALRAADAAMEDSAFDEAARRYALALECGGDGLVETLRVRAQLGRSAADLAAGRLQAARAGARDVAARLPPDDAEGWAQLALTLEPLGERAWDRDVRQWCERALRLADPADDSLRARLSARRATAEVYEGQWDDAVGVSGEALLVAERAKDPVAIAAALRARQLACSGPEFHAERVSLAERMISLGVGEQRPDIELWGRLWRIDASWEDGDLPAIATELSQLRWVVERLGSPTAGWHALVTQAALAQARGDQAGASAAGREAYELMAAIGHGAGFGAYMSLLGALGHHFGHEPMSLDVPPGLAQDEGEMRAELFLHIGPAFALAESGRLSEAATLYARPGPPQSWRIPPFFRIPALHCAAHVAIRLERLDEVAYLRDQLEPYRGRHVVGGGGAASYFGPVELVLGACAAALGELDAAERDLRDALQTCQRRGLPSFVVEASCLLAEVLVERRRTVEAHRLLESAAGQADRLGMAPWIQRIADALQASADPLSPREREVAAMVAEGLSNREIAARLVLSERTAANHVQHVLSKLGFARRAEIAAWVARQ